MLTVRMDSWMTAAAVACCRRTGGRESRWPQDWWTGEPVHQSCGSRPLRGGESEGLDADESVVFDAEAEEAGAVVFERLVGSVEHGGVDVDVGGEGIDVGGGATSTSSEATRASLTQHPFGEIVSWVVQGDPLSESVRDTAVKAPQLPGITRVLPSRSAHALENHSLSHFMSSGS